MAAYLMAGVLPEDINAYRASGYLEGAVATATAYGGVYKARGGQTTVLEGDWDTHPSASTELKPAVVRQG